MNNISAASIKLLVKTVQELSVAHDLKRVMEIARTAARQLTGADGATFVLKEVDKCYYADEDAITPLWKGSRFPMTACISGWAMIHRKAAVIEDVFADPRIPKDVYQPTFVKSLVMVPIRTLDPIGAIGNYWATQRMPTEQEVWLLQSLADITAVTIENVNMYAGLEERVQERTRQLELVNQDMEAFIYTVAHDLRAPLRSITGYSNMLLDGDGAELTDEQKRITRTIIESGNKMGNLIGRLLHFYRTQRSELNKKLVPMETLAGEIIDEIQSQEPGRDLVFQWQTLPDAHADSDLIRQVWVNLLSNAAKYTKNRPHAIIQIGSMQKENDRVYYVKDNGVGFDMAHYDKLFAVFQRLPNSQLFEGTGIGLASVQRIIERHGGKVWAESKIDEGSTFYFSLPGGDGG